MPFPIDLISFVIAATEEGPAQPIRLPANLDDWMVMFSSLFTLQLLYKVAVFFAILLAATIIGRIASRAAAAMLAHAARKPGTLQVTFIVTWIRRGVLILGLIMAIQNAGVAITPLIAGLSIGGIVLGLALQGTLSNFISGIMLMIYQPFDVDDVIETKGIIGTVVEMTMINTVLNSLDNRQVNIPNSEIWGSTIINITGNPTRRVDLTASVSYEADLDATLVMIRDLLASHPLVLKEPAAVVEVMTCAESAIVLVVRPWVATENYLTVHFDLTRTLKQLLDRNRIEIPFPQRTLHLAPKTIEALAAALRK